jgi:hypothetical protein
MMEDPTSGPPTLAAVKIHLRLIQKRKIKEQGEFRFSLFQRQKET